MKYIIANQIKTICLAYLFFLLPFAVFAQNKMIKVACIGNSITYGSGLKNPIKDSYPSVLQNLLGNQYDVRNFGSSGATMLRNSNYPYWKTPAYQSAKQFNPDIVIIKLGTNDSKFENKAHWKEYANDLSNMVDTFRLLNPNSKIYLSYPVPAMGKGHWGITDSVLVKVIIPQIKQVASDLKTELIDLHKALKNQGELFPDNIHPDESGAVLIAKAINKALTGKDAEYVPQPFPGRKSDWYGCERYDFVFNGRNAIIVTPKNPLKGNPWIWRPEFFGAFDQADRALLEKGFVLANIDMDNNFDSPTAMEVMDKFYDYLTFNYELSAKTTLFGFSRGGLYSLNWSARHPDNVACIYLDAPVCDFKSWPAGFGKGIGSSDDWSRLKQFYGFKNDQEALVYKFNPIDNLKPLVKDKIPILSVCGGTHKTVPYPENTAILKENYDSLGGSIRVIVKPDCDHHPHSLTDPAPIVDFVLQNQPEYQEKQHVNIRGNMINSQLIFEKGKVGRVAFLGGSITEMKGWHNQVMDYLNQRFPDTKFDFVEAGIASTGSTPGAFRMKKDVLKNGKVDLLFVEAAVNDDTNGFDSIAQIRGMEGEVRQALLSNPNMDIIMLHFIYDPFIALLNQSKVPDVIVNHEKVADYYQIPSINLAQEIEERMKVGEFDWKQFGGTHPLPFGQKFYAAAIERLFDKMWSNSYSYLQIKPHVITSKPLDKFSYFNGKLVDPRDAKIKNGWLYESSWKPKQKSEVRGQYRNVAILETIKPGAELRLSFTGTAFGIYCLCGPDAGIIEYSIDGEKFKPYDLFTDWSSYLYIPWVHMFATELKDSKHTIILRMSSEKNSKSIGTTCQIYYFVVNGEIKK